MNEYQTTTPRDEQCEELVLGTLLNYPKEWQSNADLLSEELFTTYKFQTLFKAAKAVVDNGDSANIITVAEEVAKNPKLYAGITPSDIATASNKSVVSGGSEMRKFVQRLVDLMRRKKAWIAATKAQTACLDESTPVEDIQSETIAELESLFSTASTDIVSISDVAKEFKTDVIEGNLCGTRPKGILSGFKTFDDRGGFQLSDMWVIAADSSQGKSALAGCITTKAAEQHYPVAIYSMEMTAGQLFARMMAVKTGIPSNILNTQPLSEEQQQRFAQECASISSLPIYFDERSTSSLDNILSSIRTMVYKNGVKLVVVDYLQILNVNMKSINKEQAMGDAARRFKNIAKELHICVIVLSQLARNRDDPRPNIARLRDSGQIAEAADGVWLVYRPEVYGERYRYPSPYENVNTKNTAMIDVAKGRNIGRAMFIVGFNASLTKFFDLPQDQLPQGTSTQAQDPDEEVPF